MYRKGFFRHLGLKSNSFLPAQEGKSQAQGPACLKTNYFVARRFIPGGLLLSSARFRLISTTNVNLFQDYRKFVNLWQD